MHAFFVSLPREKMWPDACLCRVLDVIFSIVFQVRGSRWIVSEATTWLVWLVPCFTPMGVLGMHYSFLLLKNAPCSVEEFLFCVKNSICLWFSMFLFKKKHHAKGQYELRNQMRMRMIFFDSLTLQDSMKI